MSEGFFSALTGIEKFDDVPDPTFYSKAPDDWMVIITDVEGSTKAIEAGRYKDVNALGVSSIVALQNACQGSTSRLCLAVMGRRSCALRRTSSKPR